PEEVAYIVGDKDGLTFGRTPELIGVRSPLRIQIGVFDVIDIAAAGVVQAKPLLQGRRDTLIEVKLLRHCLFLLPSTRPTLDAADSTLAQPGPLPRSSRNQRPFVPPLPCGRVGSMRPRPRPACPCV